MSYVFRSVNVFFFYTFFFKQKRGCEMRTGLEFRRVLCRSARAHYERGAGPARGGHGEACGCLGLWELREYGAPGRRRGVHGGRETIGRAGGAPTDQSGVRGSAAENEILSA